MQMALCIIPPIPQATLPPPRFSPLWKMHPQVSWADSATGICLSLYIIYEGVMSVWEAREQFVALLDGDEGLRLVRSSNLRARGEGSAMWMGWGAGWKCTQCHAWPNRFVAAVVIVVAIVAVVVAATAAAAAIHRQPSMLCVFRNRHYVWYGVQTGLVQSGFMGSLFWGLVSPIAHGP